MGEFADVPAADALSEGQMQEVQAEGRDMLLANVGGRFYAASNRCPHMGAKLAKVEAGRVLVEV